MINKKTVIRKGKDDTLYIVRIIKTQTQHLGKRGSADEKGPVRIMSIDTTNSESKSLILS